MTTATVVVDAQQEELGKIDQSMTTATAAMDAQQIESGSIDQSRVKKKIVSYKNLEIIDGVVHFGFDNKYILNKNLYRPEYSK